MSSIKPPNGAVPRPTTPEAKSVDGQNNMQPPLHTPARKPQEGWHNTPQSKTESASRRDAMKNPQAEQHTYMRNGFDVRPLCVGPMPVSAFLDFLPKPSGKMPSLAGFKKHCSKIKTDGDEKLIYEPLLSAINQSNCTGELEFYDTSTRSEDGSKRGSMKPDLCAYLKDVPKEVYQPKGKTSAHVNFGYTEFVIEVKKANDPFNDPERSSDLEEHRFDFGYIANKEHREQAQKNLGQLTHYAASQFSRQHRWVCFQVLVVGVYARLLRWDRSGVVISRRFHYQKHPNLLCEFFWRYAHATPSQRGYDNTVCVATPEQEDHFQSTILDRLIKDAPFLVTTDHEDHHTTTPKEIALARLGMHYAEKRVSCVTVNGSKYLISRPIVSPMSITSRGTRAYWAVPISERTVMLLKDTWRYQVTGMDQEGKILATLNQAKVKNIPTLVTHEDLDAHETQSPKVNQEPWSCRFAQETPRPTLRSHYRLVVKEAGYSLEEMRGTYELFNGMLCVVEAILDAFLKTGFIHRDVSVANIILYPDHDAPEWEAYETALSSGTTADIAAALAFVVRKAMLIDWELAIKYDPNRQPRDYVLTGSWQYIATMILRRIDKAHNPLHDIESAFWVTLMCTLRYVPHHATTPESLCQTIQSIFDEHAVVNLKGVGKRKETGGIGKQSLIVEGTYIEGVEFDSSAVETWMNDITEKFKPMITQRKRNVSYEYDLSDKNLQTFIDQWSNMVKIVASSRPFCDRVVHEIEGYEPVDPVQRATIPSQPSYMEHEGRRSRASSGGIKRKASEIESGLDGAGVQERTTRQRSSQSAQAPQTTPEQSTSNGSGRPRTRSQIRHANQDNPPARPRSSSRASTRKK